MAINNQYNEHAMQADDKSSLEQEIHEVLLELDRNQILSREEKLELKDHFLCEVEELISLGLREEEALLISKKRFGVLEEVNKEYQKVKPHFDWMRYGIIGVVVYCMIKILTILVDIFAEGFWMIYYQFDPAFVVNYINLDVPLRFALVLILGFFAGKIVSRQNFNSLISLWQFPIIYLLFEIIRRFFLFLFPISMMDGSVVLTIQFLTNNYLVNTILLAIIMLMASYKMYKMKLTKMKYT